MAVRIGKGYMGKCGRVPLAAEGQACPEACAEKVPSQRNRRPGPRSCANRRLPRSAARTSRVSRGAISNWTCQSAFLERMPRQTRHLHAHAVNRSVCGEKQRLHVRSAKGEIG